MMRSRFAPASRCAAILVVFLALVAASCPPSRIVYNSIDGVTTAAQTFVSTFKTAKANGQILDPDGSKEAKVRAAYAKFQAVNEKAIALAASATAQDQRDAALKIAQSALDVLGAVVEQFVALGGKR